MSISETIEHLKNYSGTLGLTLHAGATEEQIAEVERCYGVMLPDDFKELYRFTDGFETVEDIFNMIPLAEIISNKEENKPMWIAEYMVYADMWALEIYPDDSNTYAIVNVTEGEKIPLTNSLTEFIQALLTNGVFDKGGIYDIQAIAKYKIKHPLKPENITTLLQVFYEGLIHDIVSRNQIIAWADNIISKESEADFFFIEVSLSNNDHDLISVLGRHIQHLKFNSLVIRALYGLIYHKIKGGFIGHNIAFKVIWHFEYRNELTEFEENEIYKMDTYYPMIDNSEKNTGVLLDFLAFYKEFTLSNYEEWGLINSKIFAAMHSKPVDLSWGYEQNDNFDGRNHQHIIVNKARGSKASKSKVILQILPWIALVVIAGLLFKQTLGFLTILAAIKITTAIIEYKRAA